MGIQKGAKLDKGSADPIIINFKLLSGGETMSNRYGTRRQQAKEETRRIIYDTAHALFEEKGYAKTTMRELAARAGVAMGTIFQHFPDKASLVIDTFDKEMREVVERGYATMPETSLSEQILHLFRHIFSYYAKRPQLARIVIKEVFFLEGKTASKLDALVAREWQGLTGLFAAAAERGEIDSRTDIQDAVTAFWGYYSVTLLFGLRSPEFDAQAQLSTLGRLLHQHLHGLIPRLPQ